MLFFQINPTFQRFDCKVFLTGPIVPVDRYHFEPGEEMRHDTSPHTVEVSARCDIQAARPSV